MSVIRVTGPLAQLIERDSRELAIDTAHLMGCDDALEALIERAEPPKEESSEYIPPRRVRVSRDPRYHRDNPLWT